jgi:hypothetical protein
MTKKIASVVRLRPEPSPSGIKSSAEFIADFQPPDYLIDGLLQRRFVYSNTGATGSGKTAVTLILSAHIALGKPIGGRDVEPGNVLYLAGENPDDVCMRWIAMGELMQFNPADIKVLFRPGVFNIPTLQEHIERDVDALGGLSLVVVDTAAAYYTGNDENDNVQQGNYARTLRDLTTLPGGPTVLVNCHPVKNANNENLLPRGGGAFLNEMDGNLVSQKNEFLIRLHWQGKFRGPDFEPIPFQLVPTKTELLKDTRGRLISTVIAKPLSDEEQAAIETQSRTDEDRVLTALHKSETSLSLSDIAQALGWFMAKGAPYKSKVQRVVKRLKDERLLSIERGRIVLTEKGKNAAKKAAYNADASGGKYE